MNDYQVCNWLLSCDHFKISAMLAVRFLETLLDINVIFSPTNLRCQGKNHSKLFEYQNVF